MVINNCNDRIKLIQKNLKLKNIDAAIFIKTEDIDDSWVYYLTNKIFNFCILIITKNSVKILLSPLDEVPKFFFKSSIKFVKTKNDFYSSLVKFKTFYMNLDVLPVSFFKTFKRNLKESSKMHFKIKNIDDFKSMRNLKFPDEIEKHKKAIKITEKIFVKLFKQFEKGRFIHERDVVNFLKIETLKNSCELAFEPVVASGINSKNPHYYPGPKSKLNKGFCVIDFGVKFESYCSDITRTIFLGKTNLDDISNYNLVLDSFKTINSFFQSDLVGNKLKVSHLFDIFQKDNFHMIHALGHGVGLKVHEYPVIAYNENTFGEMQVLAIEPGKYDFKKYGIRIEDDFLLEQKSNKLILTRLSSLTRKLKVFKI